jgi:hypothetical protein
MLPERYVPKKISDISKNDKKIAVVGKVVEVTTDSFIMGDGNGNIEVFFGDDQQTGVAGSEKIASKKTIRAFCSIVGDELRLDVVQDLTGLDLNLLKTVDDLYSKAGV